jgi:hypothetical protein
VAPLSRENERRSGCWRESPPTLSEHHHVRRNPAPRSEPTHPALTGPNQTCPIAGRVSIPRPSNTAAGARYRRISGHPDGRRTPTRANDRERIAARYRTGRAKNRREVPSFHDGSNAQNMPPRTSSTSPVEPAQNGTYADRQVGHAIVQPLVGRSGPRQRDRHAHGRGVPRTAASALALWRTD